MRRGSSYMVTTTILGGCGSILRSVSPAVPCGISRSSSPTSGLRDDANRALVGVTLVHDPDVTLGGQHCGQTVDDPYEDRRFSGAHRFLAHSPWMVFSHSRLPLVLPW